MDDKELTAGLGLLAEEVETPPVDVHAVMAKARVRTRNRRLTMASALGTLAVAGAMVATISFGGAGQSPATGGPPTTSSSSPTDAQAAKLTQQLAEAKAIPEQFTVVPNDNSDTPEGATPPPPPLTFTHQPIPPNDDGAYVANARLSDGQIQMNLQILVTKRAEGAPLEHLPGTPLAPCVEGDQGCTRTQLEDGTLAAVLINQRPPAITLISAVTAQRPDGTYVQVIVSTPDGNTPLPWSSDQLLKFATAFTFSQPPSGPQAYVNEKLTQQLADARPEVIPARFTVERDPDSVDEEPFTLRSAMEPHSDEKILQYTGTANLRDAQGLGTMKIRVTKRPAGSPLERVNGFDVGPCAEGEPGCERRELPDGTVAAVQIKLQDPGATMLDMVNVVTAQRPDGTYIQAMTFVPRGVSDRLEPPLTGEELLKFATVFTY